GHLPKVAAGSVSPRTALTTHSGLPSSFHTTSAVTACPPIRHWADLLNPGLAAVYPSGVKASQSLSSPCGGSDSNVSNGRPVAWPPSRVSPSKPPDAASLPLGLRAHA